MAQPNMETVHTALSVIIYIPLTLLGLFAVSRLYDFIYPSEADLPPQSRTSAGRMKTWWRKMLLGMVGPLISWVTWLIAKIKASKHFTEGHIFKVVALCLLLLYIFLSHYLTSVSESNPILKKYSYTTKIVLTLLGAFFSVYVASLFMTDQGREVGSGSQSDPKHMVGIQPSDYPHRKPMGKKAKWAWSKTVPIYKYLLGVAIALGLSLLVLYIISKFTFLSLSLTTIAQIVAIIGLVFGIFLYINRQTTWITKIKKTALYNVLYHFIFVIPCSLVYLTDFAYLQIKETPRIVYFILLAELLIVTLYFLIPWLIRYFYTYSVEKDEITLRDAREGTETSMTHATHEMTKIMKGLSVDWSKIIREDLYIGANEALLKKYLTQQGYEEEAEPNSGNSGGGLWGRKSLMEAVTYVQTKTPLLIEEYNGAEALRGKERGLDRMDATQSEMYKAAILLGAPVYTDIKTTVGSYENLGGDIGVYNYNYGLSSWFFIHEQPPGARAANSLFTSILNYANKPNILFNLAEQTLQVKMNTGINKENIIFETTDFPLQRWNNIVVNYNGGTLDIFINKKLVSSTPNIVPYMAYDAITVGAKDGISGGVCNVAYFPVPLSLEKINLFYDALESRNPPVI